MVRLFCFLLGKLPNCQKSHPMVDIKRQMTQELSSLPMEVLRWVR